MIWWYCKCEKPTGIYADCTTCNGLVLARAFKPRYFDRPRRKPE